MAVAQVVDVRVNPNNTSQRVVLWGNGRVDTINCPDISPDPAQWYDRLDQPVARAIHITDWSAMSGYVLDHKGAFHRFGGAPELGDSGIIVGVPYWPTPIYVDWSWDPNNPGRGVVLDGYGTLHAFGGAPTPPRTGNRWNALVARRLVMQWGTTPKAYTLDYSGGIHPDYAAVTPSTTGGAAPYWPGQDIARDLVISNWSTGAGWTLDWWGGVHQFGGAAAAFGNPYQRGGDWARRLVPLSLSNPLRFLQVWAGGQEFEWVASTKPTVIAGGVTPQQPPSTVTTTTRPMLAWAYSDAQNDAQDEWEVAVFRQSYVDANPTAATNPWAHLWSAVVFETGRDPSTRAIVSPVDLGNGAYRMYVRARDTAGQWSADAGQAWASRAWTQSITLPATPTGLTAAPNPGAAAITLSVSATPSATAKLVRFDYSDDYTAANPAAATWAPVDGADAVPIAATTTTVDRFPPQGKVRAYRAVAYSNDPRVASAPSTTATAELPIVGYLLHAVDDPTLGGVITVQGLQETRTSTGGTLQGLDADYPTAIKDGSTPRALRISMDLLTKDTASWNVVEALAMSRSTLVLRRPFGDVRYVELLGDWNRQQVRAAPMKSERTPLRDMHTTSLPLVEVRPPHLAA